MVISEHYYFHFQEEVTVSDLGSKLLSYFISQSSYLFQII